MKTRLLVFLTLLAICPGCASLSEQARRNNIRVVTHPNLINGMDFVTGYTTQSGYMWGPEDIGNMAANDAAKAGYRDVFVFVELVDPGETGGQYSYGRLAMWRISIYR